MVETHFRLENFRKKLLKFLQSAEHRECRWIVKAREGKVCSVVLAYTETDLLFINVKMFSLINFESKSNMAMTSEIVHLQNNYQCDHEYLDILDGEGEDAVSFGRFVQKNYLLIAMMLYLSEETVNATGLFISFIHGSPGSSFLLTELSYPKTDDGNLKGAL